jgi:hypothetical protein
VNQGWKAPAGGIAHVAMPFCCTPVLSWFMKGVLRLPGPDKYICTPAAVPHPPNNGPGQGGFLSIGEAAYHGVPIVGAPLLAGQGELIRFAADQVRVSCTAARHQG